MAVGDYLRFAGRVRGMDAAAVEQRVAELEESIGLGAVRDELIRNLSQGYRQRVGLAQALIHEPDLVILDEPSHDLDPAQIVDMRGLLGTLKERHTILVSSHNLSEISQTCDRLLVLDAGEIIAWGTEAELSARWLDAQKIEVEIRVPAGAGGAPPGATPADPNGVDSAVARLSEIDGVRQVTAENSEEGNLLVIESNGDRRAQICRTLVEQGYDVIRLERGRQKLEGVFLGLVRGAERERDHRHTAA
jgi:ABC-2 type transport system ATP-binding protein